MNAHNQHCIDCANKWKHAAMEGCPHVHEKEKYRSISEDCPHYVPMNKPALEHQASTKAEVDRKVYGIYCNECGEWTKDRWDCGFCKAPRHFPPADSAYYSSAIPKGKD